jgi:predicted nucleic acid-binding OB-fold protein
VEEEFGLVGISTNPHSLVVIGRSSSLTEENRRKLATLQAQQNKMRILTYDDVIAAARANLERLLGPLTLKGENAELYFFKEPLQSTKKR